MPRIKSEPQSPSRRVSPLGLPLVPLKEEITDFKIPRERHSDAIQAYLERMSRDDNRRRECSRPGSGQRGSRSPSPVGTAAKNEDLSDDVLEYRCEDCGRWFADSGDRRYHKCFHTIPRRSTRTRSLRSRSPSPVAAPNYPTPPSSPAPPSPIAPAPQHPLPDVFADIGNRSLSRSPRNFADARGFWLREPGSPALDDLRGATVSPVHLDEPASPRARRQAARRARSPTPYPYPYPAAARPPRPERPHPFEDAPLPPRVASPDLPFGHLLPHPPPQPLLPPVYPQYGLRAVAGPHGGHVLHFVAPRPEAVPRALHALRQVYPPAYYPAHPAHPDVDADPLGPRWDWDPPAAPALPLLPPLLPPPPEDVLPGVNFPRYEYDAGYPDFGAAAEQLAWAQPPPHLVVPRFEERPAYYPAEYAWRFDA